MNEWNPVYIVFTKHEGEPPTPSMVLISAIPAVSNTKEKLTPQQTPRTPAAEGKEELDHGPSPRQPEAWAKGE